ELLAVNLIGIVPEDESVISSANRGQPVVNDSKSRAGMAFHDIARRLRGEEIPFPSLDVKEDFFKKLFRVN
ncbi:MAG: septum site-determining protein MinD, partial [Leptolinea sp.]|nr:septum site-determining protein MinD [Leptolinea sp.]